MQTREEKSGRERFLLHKREVMFMGLCLSLFVGLGGTLKARTDDPEVDPVLMLGLSGTATLVLFALLMRGRAKVRRQEQAEGLNSWPFEKYRYNAKFKAAVYSFVAVACLVIAGRYYFLPDPGMYLPNPVTIGAAVALAMFGLVRVLVILGNLREQRAIHEHESRRKPASD